MAEENESEQRRKHKARIKREAIESGAIVEDALRSIADRIGDILEDSIGQISTHSEKLIKSLERDVVNYSKTAANSAAELGIKASEGILKESDITKKLIKQRQFLLKLEMTREQFARNVTAEGKEALESVTKQIAKVKEALGSWEEDMDKIRAQNKKINEALGISGKLLGSLDGMAKKLGLGDMFEDASLEATKVAQEVTKMGGKEGVVTASDKAKVLGAVFKSIGDTIKKNINDPLVHLTLITTGIVKLWKMVKSTLLDIDKEIVELGRNFGISNKAANQLTHHFSHIASHAKDATNLLGGDMAKSFTEINEIAGTFGEVSDETLVTWSNLSKYAGYSKESLSKMFTISKLTGKSFKETMGYAKGEAMALSASAGFALNEKQILEDISNVSDAILLSSTKNGMSLVKASFNAKKLGLNLQEVEKVAESLLDFESSIQNELEAELLTNRQLNLEKARQFAMMDDMAGVASELSKQGITATEFANKNVFAQRALAKSFGMQRDEMAKMLTTQELMGKFRRMSGLQDVQNADELAKKLQQGLITKEEIAKIGGEELAQQVKNISINEQMQVGIAKIKEMFVEELIPHLDTIKDGLKTAFDIVKKVFGFLNKFPLGGIAGLTGGLLAVGGITSLVRMFGGIKSGILGKLGTKLNPMYVRMSEGVGGIMDSLTGKSGIFKHLFKKGGLGRTFNRAMLKLFGRKGANLTKGITSTLSRVGFGGSKIARAAGPLTNAASGVKTASNLAKGSKFLKVAKVGGAATGGLLSVASLGMDAYANSQNQNLTGAQAFGKTVDQNKGMMIGAAIGMIGGPVGAAIGAGIGGLVDLILPTIGDWDKKEKEAQLKREKEQGQRELQRSQDTYDKLLKAFQTPGVVNIDGQVAGSTMNMGNRSIASATRHT